ncbi:hypothetical protein [Actinomadura formosensis]|uniref:hypothetical protein n=1 Tax=Actinomadura formosensis TaxID=60706 RepID=UPI003D8F89F9
MNLEHLQAQLNDLAIEIKRWDEHRQHLSHKENNEGGAYTEWHDSDDWAVEIVRSMQQILGDSAIATPTTSSLPPPTRQNR